MKEAGIAPSIFRNAAGGRRGRTTWRAESSSAGEVSAGFRHGLGRLCGEAGLSDSHPFPEGYTVVRAFTD